MLLKKEKVNDTIDNLRRLIDEAGPAGESSMHLHISLQHLKLAALKDGYLLSPGMYDGLR